MEQFFLSPVKKRRTAKELENAIYTTKYIFKTFSVTSSRIKTFT